MPATAHDPLTTARSYLEAWSSREFDRATALLADNLTVEVPINDYPTKQSFAAALEQFGATVASIELLAAMGDENEAMLLYDMNVPQLGTIRMAEHFTVHAGQITRLRHIHDTTLMRRTESERAVRTPGDYTGSATIVAPIERVYAALTTLEGLANWWTPLVTGSPEVAGQLRLHFEGVDELIRMRVDELQSNAIVVWTCLEHSGDPDWTGSRLTFELTKGSTGTVLSLAHGGIPAARVRAGWEHFLQSITGYIETGIGQPYTA